MNIKNDIDNEACNFTNDASLKLKGCYLNYVKENLAEDFPIDIVESNKTKKRIEKIIPLL